MDKILEEAVNNIVEIFIIDVENVALAKGAVSKILKKLVEEKFTSTNKDMPKCNSYSAGKVCAFFPSHADCGAVPCLALRHI